MLDLDRAEFEFEQATDHIVDDKRAEIADVSGGVNSRATVVETEDAIGVRRREFF